MVDSRWKLTKVDSSVALSMDKILIAVALMLISSTGAELSIPEQVVPQGIESANGSNVNMGCTSPLVDSGDGVKVCNKSGISTSYLLDCISPTINTSTSDWASQLVTVRKSEPISGGISSSHVVLTFVFDTAVTLAGIEVDMFFCPEWNIGTATIDVYGSKNRQLVFRTLSAANFYASSDNIPPPPCDSQSTVTITPEEEGDVSYRTWHILFYCNTRCDWVHVGEIRFMSIEDPPTSPSTSWCMTIVSTCCSNSSGSATITLMPGNISTLVIPTTTPTPSAMPNATGSERPSSTTDIPPTPDISSTLPSISASSTETAQMSTTLVPLRGKRTGTISRTTSIPTPSTVTTPPSKKLKTLQFEIIAGIAGAGLVFFFIVVTAVCCILVLCCSRTPRKAVPYDVTREQNGHTSGLHARNGHPISTTTPIIPLVENDMYGDFYEQIPAQMANFQSSDMSAPTASNHVTGIYDFITSPEIPTEASALISQDEPSAMAMDTKTDENIDTYIEMVSCTDRSISPDLEQHLKRRPTLSEGIYSVAINPADFVRDSGQRTETEQNIDFFTPIYPTLTAFPDGFQPTIEVSSENIKETKELRVGHFRETVLATTVELSLKSMRLDKTNDDTNISMTVAVKKLKPHPSHFQWEKETFNRETQFLSQLKHPNVLRLLGVCYHDPAFIMMEYLEEGDLNQFLQKCSEIVTIITPSSSTQITTFTVISMASQIANAMKYLTELHFIHRDLAARNCFVGTNAVVKVADLGVDINRYGSHYYSIRDNMRLPIRWMARECFDGKYSKGSDVWAFGVTMWELFTLAKNVPYPNLSDAEVIHNAFMAEKCQQYPSKPVACPQPVYEIMQECWVADVKERATFIELHKMLQEHL